MFVSPQFATRCRNVYNGLVSRTKEKRDKNQRIIRHGSPIPFTCKQLTAWLLDEFKSERAAAACRYCGKPIDAFSCAIDHKVPLKRGGNTEFTNLDAKVCSACNQEKGALTPPEFEWFRARMIEMAIQFPVPGSVNVRDITSRLQKAVPLAAAMRRAMAQRTRATVVAQVDDDDDF